KTSDAIPVRVGDPLVYTETPSWDHLTPVVLHLDAIKDMNVKPHGKRTFDKHGKEHNNLHWHVRIEGTDSLGKKFKKDVKVYNCDPRYATADEDMPDEDGGPAVDPMTQQTTTTTTPGGTTTTTTPNAPVCDGHLLGDVLNPDTVNPGGGVGVAYV